MKFFTAFTTITLLLTITVTLLTVGGCSEEEEPAMFVEVTPANGSTIKEREVIIVTFNRPPEELTITGGDFSLSDYLFSDASVEIRGPFTPGAINITLTWTGGAQTLTYIVEPVEKDTEVLVTGLGSPRNIALDVAGGKMYWIEYSTDKIQRSNLDGSNVQTLVTESDTPSDIALDVASGKIYWTRSNPDKIQRSNLDGSNVEDILTGLDTPRGIAVDVAGRKIYWVEYDDSIGVLRCMIRRSNLDGSNVQTRVTGLGVGYSAVYDIALDVAGGKIYWIEYDGFGIDKIQRSNLDGSNIEDLTHMSFGEPYGIALDVAGGKIYWIEDGGSDLIERSNLDGSNAEGRRFITGLNRPNSMALDVAGGKIYWTDVGDIKCMNLGSLF